jgi:hypothetical protein
MGDNSFGHSIGIGRTYWPPEWCADAVPSASTLLKTITESCMQSIIHVPVELELLSWGTIPSATASAGTRDNSFRHGIGIGHIYWPAELHAAAAPSASTLLKTVGGSLMQSNIHVPIELELLAQGTIPSAMASASAIPIDLLSGVPMPFLWPPHYSKQ